MRATVPYARAKCLAVKGRRDGKLRRVVHIGSGYRNGRTPIGPAHFWMLLFGARSVREQVIAADRIQEVETSSCVLKQSR